jgi:hypothetical protein
MNNNQLEGSSYIRFDDRCFANPYNNLEWILRYGSEEDIINYRYIIASYIGSYKWIINATNTQRNYACNKIKGVKNEKKNN